MKKNSYLEELKKGNQTLTNKVSDLEEQIKILKKENYNLTRENHQLRSNVASLERDVQHFKKLADERDNPVSRMVELVERSLM